PLGFASSIPCSVRADTTGMEHPKGDLEKTMFAPHSTSSRRHVTSALIGCAFLCCAVESSNAQRNEVAQAGKPFAAFSASAHSLRDSMVALARAQIGKRYVRGGQSPERGFDCSGLVRYVLGGFRVDMPRTARQQATEGLAVTRDTTRLRPGDLLTFGKGTRGVSHIGIYVGNGRYVHASR